jgi:chromosomal replication initiation ATPase DnaA
VEIDFRKGSHEGRFLGSDEFLEKLFEESHVMKEHQPLLTIEEILEAVCNEMQVSKTLASSSGRERLKIMIRGLAAYFVRLTPHLTLKELSKVINKEDSSLGKLAQGIEKRILLDSEFALTVNRLRERLKLKS